MFCSRSISVHLLRGLGAAILVLLMMVFGRDHIWLIPPLAVGALWLMRGCPMCWLMGLFETMSLCRSRIRAGD
jgi:MFS superfamily sulfate permease-like transporter